MHRVTLNIHRYELDTNYGIRQGLQAFFRVPYDVKAQRVRYTTLDGAPFIPPYGDIHHRTETLTGISDPTVGVEWSRGSQWVFGGGFTLPAGHTVPNPIILGREGLKHEHIQFGSGTFRPLLSAQWVRPISRMTLVARSEATLSLYENNRGFRAPTTIAWQAGPQFQVRSMSVSPSLSGQWQSIGRWNGEADEGSGYSDGGITLRLAIPLRGFIVTPAVFRELWSHSLSDESFRQGTTFSVGLSWSRGAASK